MHFSLCLFLLQGEGEGGGGGETQGFLTTFTLGEGGGGGAGSRAAIGNKYFSSSNFSSSAFIPSRERKRFGGIARRTSNNEWYILDGNIQNSPFSSSSSSLESKGQGDGNPAKIDWDNSLGKLNTGSLAVTNDITVRGGAFSVAADGVVTLAGSEVRVGMALNTQYSLPVVKASADGMVLTTTNAVAGLTSWVLPPPPPPSPAPSLLLFSYGANLSSATDRYMVAHGNSSTPPSSSYPSAETTQMMLRQGAITQVSFYVSNIQPNQIVFEIVLDGMAAAEFSLTSTYGWGLENTLVYVNQYSFVGVRLKAGSLLPAGSWVTLVVTHPFTQ